MAKKSAITMPWDIAIFLTIRISSLAKATHHGWSRGKSGTDLRALKTRSPKGFSQAYILMTRMPLRISDIIPTRLSAFTAMPALQHVPFHVSSQGSQKFDFLSCSSADFLLL